jgi:hypothetical protein
VDPKGQDEWPTYVEYLAFEAGSLYVLAKTARQLEKAVETCKGDEDKYQAAKALAEQQQSGVDWVLSEIDKIEAEQKVTSLDESGGSSTSGSTVAEAGKRGIQMRRAEHWRTSCIRG